jgi:hypothetical protein
MEYPEAEPVGAPQALELLCLLIVSDPWPGGCDPLLANGASLR